MKEVKVCNKPVHVWDDLFTYQQRISFFQFMQKSFYKVDGGDYSVFDNQIYSQYTNLDLMKLGFMETDGFSQLNKFYNLEKREYSQIRINFSSFSEKNRVHHDGVKLTLLYYANLEWDIEWGGHTFFLNEQLTDIEYTCVYNPGRVVVFDGSLPHMIMSPNVMSQKPRFSLVIQYHGE